MARCITFSSLKVEPTKNMNVEAFRIYIIYPAKIVCVGICILSPCAYIMFKKDVLHICFTFFLLALFSSRVAVWMFLQKLQLESGGMTFWDVGKGGFGKPPKEKGILNEMCSYWFVWVAKKDLCHVKMQDVNLFMINFKRLLIFFGGEQNSVLRLPEFTRNNSI